MDMAALHSLEHLTAELIRNHADYIVDWSPMGCQTGLYLTVLNHDNIDEIMDVVALTMQDVLTATEVSRKQSSAMRLGSEPYVGRCTGLSERIFK